MNSKIEPDNITRIGLPPAGGCKQSVIIMKKIANPTAIPSEKNDGTKIVANKTPDAAEIKCPNIIFFGLANGLLGNAVISTTDAPKVGIIHKIKVLVASLISANKEIQPAAAIAERIGG